MNKREEIIATYKTITKANEDYKKGIELLDVQRSQAKEFIEAEFGKVAESMYANPYDVLKQYYKTIIDELKQQIISFQGSAAHGQMFEKKLRMINTIKEESSNNPNANKELNQALEGMHTMVLM